MSELVIRWSSFWKMLVMTAANHIHPLCSQWEGTDRRKSFSQSGHTSSQQAPVLLRDRTELSVKLCTPETNLWHSEKTEKATKLNIMRETTLTYSHFLMRTNLIKGTLNPVPRNHSRNATAVTFSGNIMVGRSRFSVVLTTVQSLGGGLGGWQLWTVTLETMVHIKNMWFRLHVTKQIVSVSKNQTKVFPWLQPSAKLSVSATWIKWTTCSHCDSRKHDPVSLYLIQNVFPVAMKLCIKTFLGDMFGLLPATFCNTQSI